MIKPSWDEKQPFVVGAAGCLDLRGLSPALVALPIKIQLPFFCHAVTVRYPFRAKITLRDMSFRPVSQNLNRAAGFVNRK